MRHLDLRLFRKDPSEEVCKGNCKTHIKQGLSEQIEHKVYSSTSYGTSSIQNFTEICTQFRRWHNTTHKTLCSSHAIGATKAYNGKAMYKVKVTLSLCRFNNTRKYWTEVSNQLPAAAETLSQESRYPLDRRMARVQSRSGRGEEKFLLVLGVELRFSVIQPPT